MIALVVDSKDLVHRVYDKALELGGTDEGAAGPRMEGFYAGQESTASSGSGP